MKGMRVGEEIKHIREENEGRKFDYKKETRSLLLRENELRELQLCLLQHQICSELGDKAQPDPHIRHTGL